MEGFPSEHFEMFKIFQDIFKDTFWFVERLEVVSLATVHGIFGSAVVSWRALESETKKESLKKRSNKPPHEK